MGTASIRQSGTQTDIGVIHNINLNAPSVTTGIDIGKLSGSPEQAVGLFCVDLPKAAGTLSNCVLVPWVTP
jgi:hypothetical protein